MKKIVQMWLDYNDRLLIIDDIGKQYRIDTEDCINPRFIEVKKDNVDYINIEEWEN